MISIEQITANLQAAEKRSQELFIEHFAEVGKPLWQTMVALRASVPPPPQAIWERYSWELIRWLGGTSDTDFPTLQVVPFGVLGTELKWDDSKSGDLAFMRFAADNVPDWNVYYRGTGIYFSDQYESFLKSVTKPPIDEEARKKAEEAILALEQFQQRRQRVIDNINLRWLDYDRLQRQTLPPSQWMTREEWFREGNYNLTIDEYIAMEVPYWASTAYWKQKSMGGPDGAFAYEILYRLQQQRVKVPTFSGDGKENGIALIRPYSASPGFADWLQSGRDGKLSRTALHIKHDTGTRNTSHTTFGAGAGFDTPFISIGVRGYYDKVETDYQRQGFELNFSAAIQKFDINPGEWFNSAAISYFKDGPFEPGVVKSKHDAGKLFGRDGFLSLRPIQAIVAFNPEVTITIVDQSYHYMKSRIHGEAVVRIGPFSFGGAGYDDEKEFSHWDDRSQTVTFSENRNKAFLLAMNNFEFKA